MVGSNRISWARVQRTAVQASFAAVQGVFLSRLELAGSIQNDGPRSSKGISQCCCLATVNDNEVLYGWASHHVQVSPLTRCPQAFVSSQNQICQKIVIKQKMGRCFLLTGREWRRHEEEPCRTEAQPASGFPFPDKPGKSCRTTDTTGLVSAVQASFWAWRH